MLYLSKSEYCSLWQCPKMLWLRKNRPELNPADGSAQGRMEAGKEVGELARGLFGEYVDVTVRRDDYPDVEAMLRRTREEMAKGTPVICEAAFRADGLYCAVDILRKEGDGWAIYEVKSSTHDDKAVFVADVSFQKTVLERCGVTVAGTYLVSLNREYIFDGTLDIEKLFQITDIGLAVMYESVHIGENLCTAEETLRQREEPAIDISKACKDPIDCPYWKYCTRHLPQPSVFDLYRIRMSKALDYYYQGMVSMRDVLGCPDIKNSKQLRQIEFALEDKGTYTDPPAIREFLRTLRYPLYFLDFETVQPVIPRYVGTHPYTQVPFQYSLHYIEREGGELKHKEFLAKAGEDPRRALAEQLCADIPMGACVTAYNKSFECTRIKELAETFPDLAEHLTSIRENIRDLLDPFRGEMYYNRAMGGSFSIKSVLPALFPDDPSLNYHNLEGIHNGSEAMNAFLQIGDLPPEEQETVRHNLLRYCELDTYAMVKIWQELVRVAERNSQSAK